MTDTIDSKRLEVLERELEQLRVQLPAHSISPAVLARIDDLEEQIANLRAVPDE